MFNKSVALHRLLQSIAWQGSVYSFYRMGKNIYGEKAEDPEKIADVNGIYHNGSATHVKLDASDAGLVWDKNTPYILTSWGNSEKLQLEDLVTIDETTFKLTGKTNIGGYSIICELSLEKVLE